MKKFTGFNHVPTRFALNRRVRYHHGKKFVYYERGFKSVVTVDAGFFYAPYIPRFRNPM